MRYFTDEHEWIDVAGRYRDRRYQTDYAQGQLGDIVFCRTARLSAPPIAQGKDAAVVESVKGRIRCLCADSPAR